MRLIYWVMKNGLKNEAYTDGSSGRRKMKFNALLLFQKNSAGDEKWS